MAKYIFQFFLILGIAACSHYPDDVEQALRLAGENRTELEMVLEHYSKRPEDQLKLQSAYFLIANMQGHFSYRPPELMNRFYDDIDSLLDTNGNMHWQDALQQVEAISKKHFENTHQNYDNDLYVVTAKYLIDNIESAFGVWQNGEWATHVGFDDFCEYILPYKSVELQTLDNWRDYTRHIFKTKLNSLYYCDQFKNSAYWACDAVNREMMEKINPVILTNVNTIPVRRMRTLLRMSIGSCEDYSKMALSVMRSKGIPVAEDFTPQWPFRNFGHSWNVVLANSGKNVVFGGVVSHPGEPHKPDEKMAKVFRRCYAINRELIAVNSEQQPVHNIFSDFHIKDVTDEYIVTEDVEIEIVPEFRGKFRYAYLSVFDNQNWVPVHWGKVNGRKVVFRKMGKNIIYLPVFITEKGLKAFSEPFLLTAQGEIKPFCADSSQRQTLILDRKYYLSQRVYDVRDRMMGGKFQAANTEDFRDSLTLHRISGYVVKSDMVNTENVGAYRYWRYCSPDSSYGNIAEIYFFEQGTGKQITGRIIGTEGSNKNRPPGYEKEAVFDRNPLTFFEAPSANGSWVGMDFGKPVEIGRIYYVPRSDGNDVTIDHLYELFYWDKAGWISLGQKLATDIRLVYENVPVNTIFLLRDLTSGKEERIFTYENSKQIWW